MKRLCKLLRQQEFHVLFFAAGFVLFNWPLLTLFDLECAFLFAAWAVFIVILLLIGTSRLSSDSRS
ncbi:MAG: hypothetical protein RBS57_10020 [Desulforhabdus sp.]|jgi:hypothetical protein|nr:hypothetical protein [Desulforhabdus sp.]